MKHSTLSEHSFEKKDLYSEFDFLRDEKERAGLKKAKSIRLYTFQIPLLRTIGFVLLLAGVALHNTLMIQSPLSFPQLALVILLYSLFSWIFLYKAYQSGTSSIDWSLAFFVLDLFFWNMIIYATGGEKSWLFFILLARVMDQVFISVKRVLFFAHICPLSYLGLLAYLNLWENHSINWHQEIIKLTFLYIFGIYLCMAAMAAERLRNRLKNALRFARQILQDLENEKIKAQQASEAKSIFLSNVSHELRTPLTSILGSLRILESLTKNKITEKEKQLLDISLRNCKRLVGLVNDILDLNKIEAGEMEYHIESISIYELVHEAAQSCESYAPEKNIKIIMKSSHVDFYVKVDPKRLHQVLFNILSNAVKFSPKDSTIEISLKKNQNWGEIRVRDYGIGIPKDKRESVFQKFYQIDSSDTKNYAGTGLGLAISREIIRYFGGDMYFEDPPRGSGIVMVVRLPLIQAEGKDLPVLLLYSSLAKQINHTELKGYRILKASHHKELKDLLTKDMPISFLFYDLAEDIQYLQELGKEFPKLKETKIILFDSKGMPEEDPVKLPESVFQEVLFLENITSPEDLRSQIQSMVEKDDSSPSILHIEDEKDIYQMIVHLLGDYFKVDWAENVKQAKEKLLQKDYSLILLDIYLPGESGLDFLKWYNKSSFSHIPVIVFSVASLKDEDKMNVAISLIKTETSNEELVNAIWSVLASSKKNKV